MFQEYRILSGQKVSRTDSFARPKNFVLRFLLFEENLRKKVWKKWIKENLKAGNRCRDIRPMLPGGEKEEKIAKKYYY